MDTSDSGQKDSNEAGFDIENFFREGIEKALHGQARLNIMLVGRAGVGKSTLVNSIFNEQIAPTGVGAPVTRKVTPYTRPHMPITVYDTPGIELGTDGTEISDSYLREIKAHLPHEDERIHFALYCISASTYRFESVEAEVIAALARHVKVAMTLTHCLTPDNPDTLEFVDYLATQELPVLNGRCFLTLAQEARVSGIKIPPFGLSELVRAIYEQLPDAERQTFASYQQVSLQLKVVEAKRIVNARSRTAAMIAAAPIPLLDAIPLSILQIEMLGQISTVMGFEIDPKAVASALATVFGVATVARTAASFFKIFPGVGSVINMGIASATTKALGEVFTTACSRVLQRQIDGEVIDQNDLIKELIRELPRLRN